MASLNSLWIKEETLQTLLDTIKKKGEKGVALTIGLNDEANQWNQNVSAWVQQTKEQQDAKANKYYVGNGRTFWSKGETPVFKLEQSASGQPTNQAEPDGLPF